ncbi:MAG: 23S rRNA (guanosine(2251)-2'-O)-methyltransferase RlmB [Candidatus Binataceae bacterium]|nr:23S rRNA (guanosine(2251)-2'-O)-methyltransferase RlmB [Candidatus Binataceae bacterium]
MTPRPYGPRSDAPRRDNPPHGRGPRAAGATPYPPRPNGPPPARARGDAQRDTDSRGGDPRGHVPRAHVPRGTAPHGEASRGRDFRGQEDRGGDSRGQAIQRRQPREYVRRPDDARPPIAPPYERGDERRRDERRGPAAPAPGAPDRAAGANRDLIFGVEPVRELIVAAPGAVRMLYVKIGAEARFAAEIDAARTGGASVIRATDDLLARMAGPEARHQGLVAIMREYQYAAFEAVVAAAPDPLIVVDGVTDPRNLGAILRSAECAGAGAVVIARDRTVGITPAAVKASAGAWVHLQIARCGNVAQALETLKAAGYWIAALAPAGELSIYELDTSRRLALVVGSEGRGVRDIVRKRADFVTGIPMRGKIDSLNVSVAVAVALFEITRRRQPSAAATSSAEVSPPAPSAD